MITYEDVMNMEYATMLMKVILLFLFLHHFLELYFYVCSECDTMNM